MIPSLILFASLSLFWWLIRRDCALRPGVSRAIWVPTLWVGILCSRPVSAWLGAGSGVDTLEGSPLDRLFYLVMIVLAALILARRNVSWGRLFAENWGIFLFYGFLLVSVLWANSSVVSFKRWFKEVGNILIVLVILTEPNPFQALRAVFVRCGYVLIPLSLIFIRYFPHLGRVYNIHSGGMEATGVTFQKNSLGTMLLVCGLICVWEWLERTRPDAIKLGRIERFMPPLVLGIAGYLLVLSDSKTSMVCLILGSAILAAVRVPFLQRRISAMGIYGLVATVAFFAFESTFGVVAMLVESLGRDMTFTGRTDVWRELLNVGTDPFLGTGFMSFWDDPHFQSRLPNWVAFSAHNGYIEVYLAGGFLGVGALVLMLLAVGFRINRALATGTRYSVVRFAVYCIALVANFAESNFGCMTPLGLLFLAAAIGHVPQAYNDFAAETVSSDEAQPLAAPLDRPAVSTW